MKILLIPILFFIMINNLLAQQFNTIDSILSDYNIENSPGASLLISKDDEIIYKNNYGFANLEENIPVTAKTNFRLASVTKQFTAASILILIQEGKLKFENNLTEIFNDFPDYGKEIKIQNLLNHTSGLIDYEDLIPDTATVQVMDADVLKMMKQQDSTYFSPGSKFQYSNSAYAVLAMIVEKISGKSFPEFLEENIFTPLEMNSTVAHINGINEVEDRAYGYAFIDGKYIRKDQSITSAVLGDGGIYSNVGDLFKWIQSLKTEKILSSELISASTKRGNLNNGEQIDYGFGWHLINVNGSEIIYHTGSTSGFRNIIYRIPQKDLLLILLTNRNYGNEKDTRNLAEKIIETLDVN